MGPRVLQPPERDVGRAPSCENADEINTNMHLGRNVATSSVDWSCDRTSAAAATGSSALHGSELWRSQISPSEGGAVIDCPTDVREHLSSSWQ